MSKRAKNTTRYDNKQWIEKKHNKKDNKEKDNNKTRMALSSS